jgi:Leucine-rich repeat (LRR) protein
MNKKVKIMKSRATKKTTTHTDSDSDTDSYTDSYTDTDSDTYTDSEEDELSRNKACPIYYSDSDTDSEKVNHSRNKVPLPKKWCKEYLKCNYTSLMQENPEESWKDVKFLRIYVDDSGPLTFLKFFNTLMHLEILNFQEKECIFSIDFNGIESCHNLLTLKLYNLQVTSFHGIDFCSKLKSVTFIRYINISIAFLSMLPNLQKLKMEELNLDICLENNNWSHYQKLDRLEIRTCKMTDTNCLTGMNVSFLVLRNCRLKTIEYLNLKKLVHLNLRSNQITDISPLRNAKKLTFLAICDNKLKDLETINFLKKKVYIIMHNSYDGNDKVLKRRSNMEECEHECEYDEEFEDNKYNHFEYDEEYHQVYFDLN